MQNILLRGILQISNEFSRIYYWYNVKNRSQVKLFPGNRTKYFSFCNNSKRKSVNRIFLCEPHLLTYLTGGHTSLWSYITGGHASLVVKQFWFSYITGGQTSLAVILGWWSCLTGSHITGGQTHTSLVALPHWWSYITGGHTLQVVMAHWRSYLTLPSVIANW